ncbi:MAG: hypothetical protein VKK05_00290 [Synechococcus sp.]|nr:hypothetical protein [Synechococcus sp.]
MARFQFEFTPKQDAEFRELVAKQRIAAVAIAVLVVIKAFSSLPGAFSGGFAGNWQAIVFGVASFVAALYSCFSLYRSSARLDRITKSSGNDMGYLFSGLQGLENCFVSMALAILFNLVPDYIVG